MPTLLIADDNDEMLETLTRIFGLYEFDVITATNGRDAVERTRSEKPDLVILDGMMPKMNGFDACAILKKDPQTMSIPVVFLTANFMELHDRIKGLELGADDYLLKPFNSRELVARIKSILKRTNVTRTLRKENSRLAHQNKLIEAELKKMVVEHGANFETVNDPITGLYGFSFFQTFVTNEISRCRRFKNNLSVALLCFRNFDRFKEILGEQLFNYLVIKIANFLLGQLRAIDVLSYHHQMGFFVLLPQTNEDGALTALKKIEKALSNEQYVDEEILKTLEFSKKKLADISRLDFNYSYVSIIGDSKNIRDAESLFEELKENL